MAPVLVVGFFVLWYLIGFWWSLGVLAVTVLVVQNNASVLVLAATIFLIGGLAYLLVSGAWDVLLNILSILSP